MTGTAANAQVGKTIRAWWNPTKGATLPATYDAAPAGGFLDLGYLTLDDGFVLHTRGAAQTSSLMAFEDNGKKIVTVRTPDDTLPSITLTAQESSKVVRELAWNVSYDASGKAVFDGTLPSNGSFVFDMIDNNDLIDRYCSDNAFPDLTSDQQSSGTDASGRALKYQLQFTFDFSDVLGGHFVNLSELIDSNT